MTGAFTLFDSPKRIEGFKAFLTARGCDVLAPTNEWELLRFKAAGRTNVVYTNSKRGIAVVGPDIAPAAASFVNGQSWKPAGAARKDALNSRRRRVLVARLIERDGTNCFCCGKPLGDDATVEHLVSQAHGGPSRIGNLALAHAECNQAGGHLSVIEKIKLREQMHADAEGRA